MDLDRLVDDLHDLRARVERLERGPAAGRSRAPAAGDTSVVRALIDGLSADGASERGGTVLYAGAGRVGGHPAAWQMTHAWDDILAGGADAPAAVFAALANPHRVSILQLLARGAATTARIGDHLSGASAGQLHHHLKELMSAGLVHQPSRGTYAVRVQEVVPILAAIAVARDLASPSHAEPAGGEP